MKLNKKMYMAGYRERNGKLYSEVVEFYPSDNLVYRLDGLDAALLCENQDQAIKIAATWDAVWIRDGRYGGIWPVTHPDVETPEWREV